MDPKTAILLASLLAAGACSGVTDRGKEAPACKGELLEPLNADEFDGRRENNFNDIHRQVRPRVRS